MNELSKASWELFEAICQEFGVMKFLDFLEKVLDKWNKV